MLMMHVLAALVVLDTCEPWRPDALTLPSMTATHELVVPRSIPMMSEPPDACLAALELHEENGWIKRWLVAEV